MEIDEYLYTLDGIELNDRMGERLACTVFAVGAR